MTLNSYFLQGSIGEQNLVQDLINEQIQIYGVEVYYLPRKIFKTDNIIKEIQSSKFDDSFLVEVYLNNYDGYAPDSDVMTKFGLRLKNEVNITISRERFEDFITPFLEGISAGIREGRITGYDFGDLVSRPKEGDLIYFPLGERLFEIKRVEFEKPFYQLGKLYTYDLSCELFEYENELIDTSIDEVDNTVEDEGYITTVNLVGLGITATATAGISSGCIREIFLDNDGSGYTSTPIVSISAAPAGGFTASAVAITTSRSNITSIYRLEMTNTGAGYTEAPIITISGGGGSGAAATCSISTSFGIQSVIVAAGATGYSSTPLSTVTGPPSGINTAIIHPVLETESGAGISTIRILNSGIGYTVVPTIVFSTPGTGVGTFYYNEDVTGQSSGITAKVRNFRKDTDENAVDPPTTLQVALNTGKFYDGEIVVGSISTATYLVKNHDLDAFDQTWETNEDIETEADNLLDFTESNPFGDY
tara:strand:- start:1061 stop:2491 length:1431 start_codon:yes stop_codon:yes gene_type:complete